MHATIQNKRCNHAYKCVCDGGECVWENTVAAAKQQPTGWIGVPVSPMRWVWLVESHCEEQRENMHSALFFPFVVIFFILSWPTRLGMKLVWPVRTITLTRMLTLVSVCLCIRVFGNGRLTDPTCLLGIHEVKRQAIPLIQLFIDWHLYCRKCSRMKCARCRIVQPSTTTSTSSRIRLCWMLDVVLVFFPCLLPRLVPSTSMV